MSAIHQLYDFEQILSETQYSIFIHKIEAIMYLLYDGTLFFKWE